MEDFLSQRESLYSSGAGWIEQFQTNYPEIGPSLLTISKIGDPSRGFVFFFPLILGLNYVKGVRFLGTFIVSEWVNMVFKWLLHGDRPYWWVRENTGQNLTLIQTSLTCETGPGVPSGHSQAGAVVWYCLIDTIISSLPSSWIISIVAWTSFICMQLAMFFSRTYIAAHFPHQCLLGILTGLILVRFLYTNCSWLQYRTLSLVIISIFLLVSSLMIYNILVYLQMDPNWSIQLAKKHCDNPEWIYVDTTPFYAMARFSGSAVGLSISGFLSMSVFSSPGPMTRIAALTTGLLFGQTASLVHNNLIPRDMGLNMFYVMEYFLNMIYIIILIKMIQNMLRMDCGNIIQHHRPNRKRS